MKAPENLIYGRHPVLEALQAGKAFDKLLLQKGASGDGLRDIIRIAREREIPLQYLPIEAMDRLATRNHQGVAGFAALVDYCTIDDILSAAYGKGETPLLLVCDGITDIGNFGAIARSAACAGVHGIIVAEKGAAPISADAIKSSAGALLQVPICKVRFIDLALHELRDYGVQIVATTLQTQQWLHQADLNQATAFIMGAEDKGVSPAFLKLADVKVKIPILGNFDSYNVSVATGIVLYETIRQRTK